MSQLDVYAGTWHRRLRGECAYVVCTSIYDEVPSSFINALQETFGYLGMAFGGYVHANCRDGYAADTYEHDVQVFIDRVKMYDPAHRIAQA